MNDLLELGDLVKVKGQKFILTVNENEFEDGDDEIECLWFNEQGNIKTARIYKDLLERVT
jgi:hypothetical protein